MLCVRQNILQISHSRIACLRGHIMHFSSRHESRKQLSDSKFVLCDICLTLGDSLYQDRKCNMDICDTCCGEFVKNF